MDTNVFETVHPTPMLMYGTQWHDDNSASPAITLIAATPVAVAADIFPPVDTWFRTVDIYNDGSDLRLSDVINILCNGIAVTSRRAAANHIFVGSSVLAE